MKNNFFTPILLALFVLISCESKPKLFTGYIVHKEYQNTHMSDKQPPVISQAIIVVPHPVVHTPPKPHIEKGYWVWYVANRNEIVKHFVDSCHYNNKWCGQKITFTISR